MQKKHKVAIARIFSDLIKADRIVDTGEMEYWEKVCAKYAIDQEVAIEAQTMPLSIAIDAIKNSDVAGMKEALLDDCKSMTVSDGFCAHSEALIMIALILMFDSAQPFNVETISIPKATFNIDTATALYIESDFDPDTNNAISTGYRSIFKEFQLAGFHFVYLPNIINHYKHTEPELFRRILSFLAPNISPEGISSTYKSFMKMTTDIFCKDLLCNKCGIAELRSTYPALLIKISNSFVGDVSYANYLKLEVDENILVTVQNFIDKFCQMLSSDVYVVNTSEERDNQFHFHGFYKQLLDIFLIRKNIRSSIVINPYKEEISFPDIDSKLTELHRREKALYALFLSVGDEGLNFNAPRSSDALTKYNARIKRIQSRFAEIYGMFGGDKNNAPDLSVPEIRRPIFSCLKRSLSKLPGLYNPEDYNISKSREGVFAVHIEPVLVYVSELKNDEPVALDKSELYSRIMKV